MRNSLRYLVLLLLLGIGLTAQAHPFHVSVIRMDWNAGTQSFEVAIKIFTDDLEKALKHHGMERVNWDVETESALIKYFGNFFQVEGDRKGISGKFLGFEEVEDVIWSYLEFPVEELPASLWVQADFLTEIYDDQVNVLHFRPSPEKKLGMRFNREDRSYTFDLKEK